MKKNCVSFFLEKNGYRTIYIYENCMSIKNFEVDNKIFFKSIIEIARKLFFQPQIQLCTQTKIFQKKHF